MGSRYELLSMFFQAAAVGCAPPAQLPALGGLALRKGTFDLLSPDARVTVESRPISAPKPAVYVVFDQCSCNGSATTAKWKIHNSAPRWKLHMHVGVEQQVEKSREA